LAFRGNVSMNGGDVGLSVSTTARAGSGGLSSFRATDGDLVAEGSIAVNGGRIFLGAAGASGGTGGLAKMVSANGGVRNAAAISARGGDVVLGGDAGNGGEIDLVVDDNDPASASTVAVTTTS